MFKKEKMNTEEEVNRADSEEGITIGLIDAIIAICEVLSARDMFDEKDLIQEALKDLRSNDTMKMLMDIGELQDAKDYIQEQKKIINLLCSSSELLKRIGSTDRQQSQSADVAESITVKSAKIKSVVELVTITKDNKSLPPEGKQVIFTGKEKPPIYGRIKYNGAHPSIAVYDSGGEEEFIDVYDYEQWLDETKQGEFLIEVGDKDEEIKRLRELLNDCINACKYAANNFDAGYELAENVIETTSPVGSLLIAARNAKQALNPKG